MFSCTLSPDTKIKLIRQFSLQQDLASLKLMSDLSCPGRAQYAMPSGLSREAALHRSGSLATRTQPHNHSPETQINYTKKDVIFVAQKYSVMNNHLFMYQKYCNSKSYSEESLTLWSPYVICNTRCVVWQKLPAFQGKQMLWSSLFCPKFEARGS
jgi:hypothetical protein